MPLTGVHHTGLVVQDLDRSIAFWHGVLGLELVTEPSPWFAGPELSRGVGVRDAELRQVCLAAGGDVVELLEYRHRLDAGHPVPQNHLGAMHVALRVTDVVGMRRDLAAHGVEFLSEVNVVDDGVLAGWRWVYFHDPDGISVELVEQAYTDTAARSQGIAAYLATRPPIR